MGHSIQLPQKMIFVRLSLKRKDHQSLLPNTSQNNQPIKFVNEQHVDQSDYGQFLSDFVQVKSNESPRPSALTYPQDIFD